MNSRYSKEELTYSLPDYITRSINDKDLIFQIERELELNPEFRNEHNELIKTFAFLESSELESPPESYFNNLPVKINARTNENNPEENFWGKLSIFWKILIPALPVIIISFLLINSFENENTVVSDVNTEKVKTEAAQKESNNTNSATDVTKTEINKGQIPEQPIQKKQKTKRLIKHTGKDLSTNTPDETINTNLAANNSDSSDENAAEETADAILYISDEVDESEENDEALENDFFELTPEEQKDILAILKDS